MNLAETAVTDGGLARLKNLKTLHNLILAKTAVTDAGLAHLVGLTNLTTLNLTGTKVTPKGVEELSAAMPWCRITHDAGVINPKK